MELQPGPQLQPGSVCVFGAWLCVQPGPQLQPGPACISSAPNAKPSVVCRSLDGTPTRSAAATWPGVDRTANRSAAATWPPWIQRCASSPGPQLITRWNSNPVRSCNPFAISNTTTKGKYSSSNCISISRAHFDRRFRAFCPQRCGSFADFQRFSLAPWWRPPRRGTI